MSQSLATVHVERGSRDILAMHLRRDWTIPVRLLRHQSRITRREFCRAHHGCPRPHPDSEAPRLDGVKRTAAREGRQHRRCLGSSQR